MVRVIVTPKPKKRGTLHYFGQILIKQTLFFSSPPFNRTISFHFNIIKFD